MVECTRGVLILNGGESMREESLVMSSMTRSYCTCIVSINS